MRISEHHQQNMKAAIKGTGYEDLIDERPARFRSGLFYRRVGMNLGIVQAYCLKFYVNRSGIQL